MPIDVQHLSGVPITMLIPLYARAVETQKPAPIIRDPQAVEILQHIEYDFSAFAADVAGQWGIAIRTEILDQLTADFLARHPDSLVVNLGAGLDTRFARVDNGRLHWVELDLPESIAMREHFLSPAERHPHLAHSALDRSWLTHPALAPKAHILIIAEGLFIYFTEAQVKGLLLAIQAQFPHAELLIEAVGSHMLTYPNQSVQSTAQGFQWGIDDPTQISTWGRGIEVAADISIYDRYPDVWQTIYPDLKKPLVELRHKVTKIIHLLFKG